MEPQSQKKIFLVEDNMEVSRMYERAFRLLGYDIEVAYDGQTALEKIRETQAKPDAILLDVRMPHMNGIELLRVLRSDEAYAKVAIAILTNSIRKEEEVHFLELGADLYLVKMDNQYKQIVEQVAALIKKRQES